MFVRKNDVTHKGHLGFTINGMHTWDAVVNSLIDFSDASTDGDGICFDKDFNGDDVNHMRLIFSLPPSHSTAGVFANWPGKFFGGWTPMKIKVLAADGIIDHWFGKDMHFQVVFDLDRIKNRISDDTKKRINHMNGFRDFDHGFTFDSFDDWVDTMRKRIVV